MGEGVAGGGEDGDRNCRIRRVEYEDTKNGERRNFGFRSCSCGRRRRGRGDGDGGVGKRQVIIAGYRSLQACRDVENRKQRRLQSSILRTGNKKNGGMTRSAGIELDPTSEGPWSGD